MSNLTHNSKKLFFSLSSILLCCGDAQICARPDENYNGLKHLVRGLKHLYRKMPIFSYKLESVLVLTQKKKMKITLQVIWDTAENTFDIINKILLDIYWYVFALKNETVNIRVGKYSKKINIPNLTAWHAYIL